MRLVELDSFKLHELTGPNVPRYPMLSHTGGDDDVVFRQVKKGTDSEH